MDAAALVDTLTWQLAVVCGLAFALGALGGAIHERTAPPPAPASDSAPPVIPAWRRALVGGVAAVAVLYLTSPDTGIELAGGSVAAGYAGQAVLAALEARAVAVLAQNAANERERDVKEALAATDVLVNQPRTKPTAEQEAAILAADATITRLNEKYAKKG